MRREGGRWGRERQKEEGMEERERLLFQLQILDRDDTSEDVFERVVSLHSCIERRRILTGLTSLSHILHLQITTYKGDRLRN